jgi:signal transduction histidine kinase/CheY-like chemotaxis protein
MNIKTLIFSDDPKQALRIKRCLASNKAYLVVALLTYFAFINGYLPGFPLAAIILIPLFANIIFYGMIRSRLNLYFSDPSLTIPQSVYAMLGYMFLIFFAHEVRGAFLILLLVVPMSLTLRVRPKKLFWVSLLPLIILGSITLWQHYHTEYNRILFLDLFEWAALATGAWWLTAEANYIARKRQEAKESTRNLEIALLDNMTLVENLSREKKIAEAANLSNLAKSKLVAAANHDLRQPLHALNLFVAHLHSTKDANAREKILSHIESCVISINELFENLMDISKLNTDITNPQLQNYRLNDIFKRLDNTFREAAKNKGLELRFRPSPFYVKSEPVLLERILLNLVNNALRYTQKGKILIGSRKRGNKIEIQVWDTGIGIKPEDQRRIFDEHFQVNRTINKATSHDQGMGLGLAIVNKLCALLNHQVKVKSVFTKGTCFSILLDYAEDILEPTAYPLITDNHFINKKILIIDDDVLVLKAMDGFMTPWGCRIITATSIKAAFNSLATFAVIPDLIISDYSLGNHETGIDAIKKIRRYYEKNIPAFLMSGNADMEKINEAHTAGLTLLSKPIQPMIIRSLVAQYLTY